MIFLSCKANARVFDAKSGHGPHSPPPGAAASPKRLNRRVSAVCDTASLGSEPRRPTPGDGLDCPAVPCRPSLSRQVKGFTPGKDPVPIL